MKPLLFGALLGTLWAVFGLPQIPWTVVMPLLVQPVTLAFAAGVVARPHLLRWWAR